MAFQSTNITFINAPDTNGIIKGTGTVTFPSGTTVTGAAGVLQGWSVTYAGNSSNGRNIQSVGAEVQSVTVSGLTATITVALQLTDNNNNFLSPSLCRAAVLVITP